MYDSGAGGARRARRLAAVLRQAIADEVARLSDPSLQDVAITGVDVGADLDLATVYFFARGGAAERSAAQEALERCSGRLRKSLSRRLDTRRVPNLRFRIDEGIVRGMAVDDRLAEIARERSKTVDATESASDSEKNA